MYERLRILESNYGRNFGWYVEVAGQRLAVLTDCQWAEMFWDSYRLEPLTESQDLFSDEFWNDYSQVVFRNREFGTIAEHAFPCMQAGRQLRQTGRISMRGLYLLTRCYPWDRLLLKARQMWKKAPRLDNTVEPTDGFILALTKNPTDANLWLVYADYLEERGDLRGTFFRRCPLLPAPWGWVLAGSARLVEELRREVCATHPLYKNEVVALARSCACDDVLFLSEERLALVHLTWRGSTEPDPRWPTTTILESWEQFLLHAGAP